MFTRPVMTWSLIFLVTSTPPWFARALKPPAIATALNPIIGYARAAEIVHRALDERRSIIDVVIEEGVLEPDEARRVLDPMRLTTNA
mgnify:CR=1 FL=1